ncbi:sensor histidine kinase [Parasediminibacterium sp. JCM 36343]|uniref:sensor histidine kinase n=1 Tax=Parasediminibacterium sp. JCM 36343 TaxID=3374279 RepID=UPI00397D59E9
MHSTNQEIIFVIAVACAIALLMVVFIITILFFYQRRQNRQEREIMEMKEQYQKELLNSQLEMQENTMKQISVELHDNIKQQLLLVNMTLNSLLGEADSSLYGALQETRTEVNNIINDVGQLSHSLHTDRVMQIGLLDSIHFEVEKLKRVRTLAVTLRLAARYNYYDGQTSTFIFRMFQEILQNIIKHACATEVNIDVFDKDETHFVIQVQDNGVGFVVKTVDASAKPSGIGLMNLYNRAKLIGATIDINSVLQKGTIVSLTLPIPEEEEV